MYVCVCVYKTKLTLIPYKNSPQIEFHPQPQTLSLTYLTLSNTLAHAACHIPKRRNSAGQNGGNYRKNALAKKVK